MELTNEYQYIGRSNAVSCPSGWNFYILLYAKTTGNISTGKHSVTVKQRLVCNVESTFYGFQTSGFVSVGGVSAFSWSSQKVPNTAWKTTSITEGGVTYPRWIDLKEGTAVVNTGYGSATTVKVSSSWVMNSTSTEGWVPYSGVYATANISVVLPMIAGATVPTVSASTVELGQTVTVSTIPIVTGYTHKLTYSFEGASGVITESTLVSTEWTPPVDLAAQIPNSPSGTAIITCTTFSGSTQIGNPQSVSVTLTVPDSVAPTVTATWEDASGAYGKVGAYVKLISKLVVSVETAKAYGSDIVGVSMTLGGKTYSGGTILDCGDLPLVITATDARGHSGVYEGTVTVADYSVPSVSISASRWAGPSESAGADDMGEYAKVTITGKTVDVNGNNTAALEFTHGSTTDSIPVSVGEFTVTRYISAPSASTMKLSADLSDALTSAPEPASMTLSIGYATMDFLAGGKGIAFGTTATKEGFTCAMDTTMEGHKLIGLPTPAEASSAVPLGYAQNAFSPAAYGFGNFVPIPLDADLNDYYNPGAYGIQSNEIADSISNIPEAKAGILYIVNAAGMNTIAGTWKYARQIYIPYSETGRYYARTLYKGSTEEWIFDGWEVNNPPMAVGVEYRTTERFMGNPVYAKLVSLGAAPNAAYKTVSGCYSGAKYVISCTGIASQSTGYQLSLPTFDNAGKGIGLWAYANGNIAICANYNASAYTICYALVKYIKN